MIDDMRPLDSQSSNLEYSYRPMNKISQFWAGPSHWKFKRSTRNHHSLSLQQQNHLNKNSINSRLTVADTIITTKTDQQRRQHQNINNRQSKRLKFDKKIRFGEIHDDLFLKINENVNRRLRKSNIQKKWDAKKLKLPTDFQIDSNIFDTYEFAPGIKYEKNRNNLYYDYDDDIQSGYNYDNPIDQEYCSNIRNVSNFFFFNIGF